MCHFLIIRALERESLLPEWRESKRQNVPPFSVQAERRGLKATIVKQVYNGAAGRSVNEP
jgi:hypothetical protein